MTLSTDFMIGIVAAIVVFAFSDEKDRTIMIGGPIVQVVIAFVADLLVVGFAPVMVIVGITTIINLIVIVCRNNPTEVIDDLDER